ncbi:ABC transporter ATP-binding protein [Iamia sp. SCSIO 61187]|uniref:ABC transporter ATP-binding protein n=1 Tax=Iamia sp. SCSIO 61187 TaxID=2722752 RepID=UPI001C633EBF|nr:ABC transporter ATP-binding protein [Iamia sp. SCSIO 61187]QYG93536.1 ABC transporter ATP-binding protein [Iamia sp. SCSIO 61187]
MSVQALTRPEAATPTALAARSIGATKVYGSGDLAVRALDGVSVDVPSAGFTAVMGPSGSGKSTLVHCLAGLDSLTEGEIELGGGSLSGLSEKELTVLRRDHLGFVFQSFNLIPTLDALENIRLPADLAGRKLDPEWLDTVIDAVSLRDRLRHRPSELSGGQQQRVAIARSLAGRPEIVIADEPTGNLDSRSAAEVLGFLRRAVDDFGQTVVMVTHDPAAAGYSDRVVFLADGRVADEIEAPTTERVLDRMKRFGD